MENFSSEKTILLNSASLIELVKSVMVNFPVVSVPVLSNTTCCIFLKDSSALAFLKSIPSFAALPSPTAIAAGVASPIAHGHDITKTAIARIKESPLDILNAKKFTKKVSADNTKTVGTNTALILSASFCIGGFSA